MIETPRAMSHATTFPKTSTPGRPLTLALLLGGCLAASAVTARAQGGMVVNSATTERYREQAVQGHRQHDYSPRVPPRNGRMIYGHWTPYSPPDPASYPADARKHVIATGDTLWDISNKYYKDPYLWPYVWEANSWVRYPHWIYPGDVLLVPPLMLLPSGPLEEKPLEIPDILSEYFPAGAAEAVYCGHFIADPNEMPMGEIIGSESDPQPIMVAQGDYVYVNLGSKDGVLPGDEFAILYPREHLAINPSEQKFMREDQLRHPLTGEKLGVVMKMSGRLKIVLLGEEVSTAQITYSCDSIEAGWALVPFTEVPIPLVRRKEREKLVMELPKQGRGYIVWTEDMVTSGSIGNLVSIDLGSKDGIIPGDVFRIFRDEKSNPFLLDVEHLGSSWDIHNAKRRAKIRRDPAAKSVYGKQDPVYDVPPRLVGNLVVLYTQDHTATCRVFDGTREFYLGDQIVYESVDTGLASVAVVDQPLRSGLPLSQQPQGLSRRR